MKLNEGLKDFVREIHPQLTEEQISKVIVGVRYWIDQGIHESIETSLDDHGLGKKTWKVYLEAPDQEVIDVTEVDAYSENEAEELGQTVFEESGTILEGFYIRAECEADLLEAL